MALEAERYGSRADTLLFLVCVSLSLVARKAGTSEYRLRAYLRSSPILQVLRMLNGAETVLGTVTLAVPGGSYTPGEVLHLRLLSEGTSLRGKAWFDAAAEPAAWQVQVTDSTPQLQQPGGVGIHAYMSSSATNAPVSLSVDNLVVTEA